MNIGWRDDKPDAEEPILAVVETNHATRYYACCVDTTGTLVDLEYGDDVGWEIVSIDRWIYLSDLDSLLESLDNQPPDEKGE